MTAEMPTPSHQSWSEFGQVEVRADGAHPRNHGSLSGHDKTCPTAGGWRRHGQAVASLASVVPLWVMRRNAVA
jgi:hypothetical protein